MCLSLSRIFFLYRLFVPFPGPTAVFSILSLLKGRLCSQGGREGSSTRGKARTTQFSREHDADATHTTNTDISHHAQLRARTPRAFFLFARLFFFSFSAAASRHPAALTTTTNATSAFPNLSSISAGRRRLACPPRSLGASRPSARCRRPPPSPPGPRPRARLSCRRRG